MIFLYSQVHTLPPLIQLEALCSIVLFESRKKWCVPIRMKDPSHSNMYAFLWLICFIMTFCLLNLTRKFGAVSFRFTATLVNVCLSNIFSETAVLTASRPIVTGFIKLTFCQRNLKPISLCVINRSVWPPPVETTIASSPSQSPHHTANFHCLLVAFE